MLLVFVVRSGSTNKEKMSIGQEWHQRKQNMFALHKEGQKKASLKVAEDTFEWIKQFATQENLIYVESLNHIAWLLFDLKRYEKAEKLFLEVYPLYEAIETLNLTLPEDKKVRIPSVHGLGNTMVLLGNVYEYTGRYELALEQYLDAKDYFKAKLPDHAWYYKIILNNVSNMYWKLGDKKNSQMYHREADSIDATKKGSQGKGSKKE